jgi:hypothetical protein
MLIRPFPDLIPVPAGAAERWIHCLGLRALLNDSLRIRLGLRGGPARWRCFHHRASVELPDPCAFDGAWARLAIRIRRHPRWGGLGPGDDELWQRTIPAPILLHARAGRAPAGQLAVQWCVPEPPPPLDYRAEPSNGEIVAGEETTGLRLILPPVPAAMTRETGEIAEVSRSRRRHQQRLLTVGGLLREDSRVPYLRLSGRWLGALGFHEGGTIDVRTAPGRITLDVLPAVDDDPAAGATPPP